MENIIKTMAPGRGFTFKELFSIAKGKKLYNNVDDFEIALEQYMQSGYIICKSENNINLFYRKVGK